MARDDKKSNRYKLPGNDRQKVRQKGWGDARGPRMVNFDTSVIPEGWEDQWMTGTTPMGLARADRVQQEGTTGLDKESFYAAPTPDASGRVSKQEYENWLGRNTHAYRWRTDPAYREQIQKNRQKDKWVGDAFNAAVGGVILGGVGGELSNLFSGSSGAAATAETGAVTTGGGSVTTGGGLVATAKNDFTKELIGQGLGAILSHQANQDSEDAIRGGFEAQNPWMSGPGRQQAEEQLIALLTDPSSIRDTPGYQFAYDQGLDALMARQAASGHRFSGRALEETMAFGQDLATQIYNQEMNRYAGLAGANQAISGGMDLGAGLSQLGQQDMYNTGYFLNNLFRGVTNSGGSNSATPSWQSGNWWDTDSAYF